MNTVAAFILIISTWTGSGPHYSQQEYNSEASCRAAMDFVWKHMVPPGDRTVNIQCVSK